MIQFWQREKNFERGSLIAFLGITCLLLFCAFLINIALNVQQCMLKASGVSYEQRVLLEQAGKKIRFLIENASDSSISNRVLVKNKEDISALAHKINFNQSELENLLLDKVHVRYLFSIFPEMDEINQQLNKIDGYLFVFNQYVIDISQASFASLRAGYEYWNPNWSLLEDGGPFLTSMSQLNNNIFQVSLAQNRLLYFLYGILLGLLLLSLWLVWFLMLRPLSRQLESHYREIVQKNESLAFQATHDDLTGLPRRIAFNQKMKDLENQGNLFNKTCLWVVDIDYFKGINDNFGHQAGDAALIWIAKCLLNILPDKASAYRLSGDEFAVVIEGQPDIQLIKQRAQQLFEQLRQPYYFKGARMRLGCSVGIAYGEKSGATLQEVFSAADMALYHVKREGRNHYRFYEDISAVGINQYLLMEKELLEAVDRREFVALYQPIVSLESGNLKAFEVLVRWQHPEKGLLKPGQWLELAEKLLLTSAITGQLIEQVMTDRSRWESFSYKLCPMQVNVTESLLVDGSLSHLLETYVSNGENISWLVVEVNESIMFENGADQVREHLETLARMGIGISLDDFGTGFANLAHLRTVPFDSIKLDKSFVSELISDAGMRVIVRSMIEMMNSLGKQIVCEGVENQETRSILLELGCDTAQGYLFSKPVSSEIAEGWLSLKSPN